jgi:hypothetical protein
MRTFPNSLSQTVIQIRSVGLDGSLISKLHTGGRI